MNEHYGHFCSPFTLDDRDEDSLYPRTMNTYFMSGRSNGKSAMMEYLKSDVEFAKELHKRMLNQQYGYKPSNNYYFKISKVIFNDPATIVFWADGSKTVVKCQEGDTFNKEMGLAMAISKRALGDKGNYCEEFKKWIPELEEVEFKSEVFFDDLAAVTTRIGKAFSKASEAIVDAVHECNRIDKCSTCIFFDQNTDIKKRFCSECQYYSNYVEKEN